MNRAVIERFEQIAIDTGIALARADAQRRPEVGAEWRPIGGGVATFCGIGSVLTHAIGVGRHGDVTDSDLDAIERFYAEHGTPYEIDISPLVDPMITERLRRRGFRRSHEETIYHRKLERAPIALEAPDGITVRRLSPREQDLHAHLLAAAAFAPEPISAMLLEVGRTSGEMPGTSFYIAEANGEGIATAACALEEGLGSLFGAATVPQYRARGVQGALIGLRLHDLAAAGCEEVTLTASPESTSARNAERGGFHPIYTRTVWSWPK